MVLVNKGIAGNWVPSGLIGAPWRHGFL